LEGSVEVEGGLLKYSVIVERLLEGFGVVLIVEERERDRIQKFKLELRIEYRQNSQNCFTFASQALLEQLSSRSRIGRKEEPEEALLRSKSADSARLVRF